MLATLVTLDVSSNQLRALPDLSGLGKLEVLKLDNNELGELPPSIGKHSSARSGWHCRW